MSVQPAYASFIRQGIKDIEIRTMIPNEDVLKPMLDPGTKYCDAYLYESKSNHGLGKVFGKFKYGDVKIIKSNNEELQNNLSAICKRACVDERYIVEASKNYTKPLYLIAINYYTNIDLLDISDFGLEKAPQSWCYAYLDKDLSIENITERIFNILPKCEIKQLFYDDSVLLEIYTYGTYEKDGFTVDVITIGLSNGYIVRIDQCLLDDRFKWLYMYWINKTRFRYEKK